LGKVLPMQIANADNETFQVVIERRIIDPANLGGIEKQTL
jgi:hypothetical protein